MTTRKTLLLMLTAGIMAAGVTACKEKKQDKEDIIIAKYVPSTPQPPIRMKAETRRNDVTWQGRHYVVTVVREPADSLPTVKDETGQKYVDNRVHVTVASEEGTVFFSKTFTKGSFSSYLDDDYRQRGVLETIVFHEVDGKELEFAVLVSHPDAEDEFIPLEMELNAAGGLNIERGNLFEKDNDDVTDDDDHDRDDDDD